MSKIGDNIASLRKQKGLTQEELARLIGYKSKSTINKIELGINDIPQSKIVEFARVLDTSPAILMGWDSPTIEIETSDLTQGEIALLKALDKLTEDEVRQVIEFAEFLISKRQK